MGLILSASSVSTFQGGWNHDPQLVPWTRSPARTLVTGPAALMGIVRGDARYRIRPCIACPASDCRAAYPANQGERWRGLHRTGRDDLRLLPLLYARSDCVRLWPGHRTRKSADGRGPDDRPRGRLRQPHRSCGSETLPRRVLPDPALTSLRPDLPVRRTQLR